MEINKNIAFELSFEYFSTDLFICKLWLLVKKDLLKNVLVFLKISFFSNGNSWLNFIIWLPLSDSCKKGVLCSKDNLLLHTCNALLKMTYIWRTQSIFRITRITQFSSTGSVYQCLNSSAGISVVYDLCTLSKNAFLWSHKKRGLFYGIATKNKWTEAT